MSQQSRNGRRQVQRTIVGKLVREPSAGSVVVVEFKDGLHEYVTTPVTRVLKSPDAKTYYLETANSRYRMMIVSADGGLESNTQEAQQHASS